MNGLEHFENYEMAENNDELFLKILLIQDAKARLKEIENEAKDELIRRMKEQGIREFRTGPEGNQSVIKYSKKNKKIITGTDALRKMLFSDDEAERDLSRKALSESQSVWKTSQVEVLADTLGRDDLIKTTWEDKIELKIIPIDVLKAMGLTGGRN